LEADNVDASELANVPDAIRERLIHDASELANVPVLIPECWQISRRIVQNRGV
jgi:hypothetical protein